MKVCALRLLGAATLVAAVAAGCGGGGSAGGDDRVMIGVSVEKTGPVPALGNALKGAEAAARAINAAGGIDGREIELVVRDNAGDPSKAIANVEEFHDRGIGIVVGPVFGQNCEAVAPIVAKNDMVDFCLSTQDLNPELVERQFGIGVGYTETVGFDVAFLATRGERIGVLGEKGPAGDRTESIAEPAARAAGATVQFERIETTDTTAKPQIQKLLANGVESIYIVSCGPIAIAAAREAIDLGFDGTVLMPNCFASAAGGEAMKGFANGNVLISAPEFLLGAPPLGGRKAAIERYQDEIDAPDTVVAAGWDAVFFAAQAIEQTGSTEPEAIASTLEDDFRFAGVWHAGTTTAADHRGAITDGALVPAEVTPQGTFTPLEAKR
ncbi:ABC transporter substrate-binding protein [Conexibacter stalactiti]|uniref:ABC transporter substrate-binding protein n=1 Tax=Conexibacter stalactiti TaxID=1940611 RepID=A0ABU4HSI5_9ACTN|nr:ABC transporter substrate-binding protein [Conexibacter stalactiti]MDW5596275.1 ABC transporter substrate-binding protein [Conexibacter stalactiti]MEC5036917.1 ABC transporter substrate-binding protein [Conexibacter stalactiti]